jgi:hypothetical protein
LLLLDYIDARESFAAIQDVLHAAVTFSLFPVQKLVKTINVGVHVMLLLV